MNTIAKTSALAVLLAASVAGSVALAQPQSGLVNVVIEDVNILQQVGIVANVPVTVQVPIGIAANVCNINANILAQQAQGGVARCTATSVTQGFIEQAQRFWLTQTVPTPTP